MGALAPPANVFGREFEHILIDVDDCIYRIHEIPTNVYNNIIGELLRVGHECIGADLASP